MATTPCEEQLREKVRVLPGDRIGQLNAKLVSVSDAERNCLMNWWAVRESNARPMVKKPKRDETPGLTFRRSIERLSALRAPTENCGS